MRRHETQSLHGYIKIQKMLKWGVISCQVQILRKENRGSGALRMSRIWIITENAERPTGIRHSKKRRTD